MTTQSAVINKSGFIHTNDRLIRTALKEYLEKVCKGYPDAKIIEELGIVHGAARVDIAVVSGIIHGYELKSDIDTLDRLPEQMKIYNSVLDKMTLVVGKNHLYDAINIVPEWWGIMVAKIIHSNGKVSLYNIREAGENPHQDNVAVAALLWREEALNILEKIGQAEGVRSKTRKTIYERLVEVLDGQTLKEIVRAHLCTRVNWRSDLQYMPSGD